MLNGRDGKGEKENYKMFCERCETEYLIDLETCTRCGYKTITQKARRAKLLVKVEEYKKLKNRRAERRKRWDLWKKTESMNHKKMSTNYDKWEVLTDSEDEFEELENQTDPVVPENDPKFAALKKDMDERKIRMDAKRNESDKLKQSGNKCMRSKNYLQAIEYYTKALDLTKGNKYLWTNRALAHIKREDFDSAIDDCTKILEYCDVLEDGYTKSRDAAFKAFARRAMAYKGKEAYKEALGDVEECLKLFPEDESILILQTELIKLQEQKKKIQEIEESLGIDSEAEKEKIFTEFKSKLNKAQKKIFGEMEFVLSIKEFKDVTESVKTQLIAYDYAQMAELGKQANENLALFFYSQGGFDSLKRIFKLKAYTLDFRPGKINFTLFIHLLLNEKNQNLDVLQQGFVKNNFARIVIKRINNHLVEIFGEKAEETESKSETDPADYNRRMIEVESFTELLVCFTENRSNRLYFREKGHLLTPIFSLFYQNMI